MPLSWTIIDAKKKSHLIKRKCSKTPEPKQTRQKVWNLVSRLVFINVYQRLLLQGDTEPDKVLFVPWVGYK